MEAIRNSVVSLAKKVSPKGSKTDIHRDQSKQLESEELDLEMNLSAENVQAVIDDGAAPKNAHEMKIVQEVL